MLIGGTMRVKIGFGIFLSFLLSAGLASADIVYDSFNIGLPLQNNQNSDNCCVFGIPDIGWYYTPAASFTLDQIETVFDTLGTNRTVTFEVFTDRPANGGASLGSATFATSEGTLGGPVFGVGIPLVGGHTYFVGLENVMGLGVNQVTFESTGVEGTPPGSVSPGTSWQDSSGAQFGTEGCSDTNNWFCKPEIEFLGPAQTPEPSYVLLTAAAALAMVWRNRRRRNGRA
jgi:hypothetical protein